MTEKRKVNYPDLAKVPVLYFADIFKVYHPPGDQ
jgi:hypothetical protein